MHHLLTVDGSFPISSANHLAVFFCSTKTTLKKLGDIKDEHYDGSNIWFGVREHAMGAILNGMALSNLKVFGSTFLVFSDYLKPAIRMSALMNLPVIYIFTISNPITTLLNVEVLYSLKVIILTKEHAQQQTIVQTI